MIARLERAALSTTLLYGPMATMPSARRVLGATAHAASSTAAPASGGAYNFQDFKDIKGKLSLAPGANVGEYEEILAKVEVEGEKALEDRKYGEKAALTIGDSGEEGGDAASSSESEKKGRRATRAERKAQKKAQKKKSQVSEWESDEFGFGEDDDKQTFKDPTKEREEKITITELK